ncbi:MAG: hypothetical protein ACLQGP_25710 [Isosphaeraceae bacterium]
MIDENERADDDLLLRLEGGDERALTELFTRHRERLRRMTWPRLDRRLQGRIDSSDLLQDAYLDAALASLAAGRTGKSTDWTR